MDVRPGYKMTEVGVIPEDWEVRRLGDLFDVFAGGDFDLSRSSIVRDERYPFPVYSNTITSSGLYGFCSYSMYSTNTITVTARGTLGVANYRDHPYTAIGRVLVLQPKSDLDGRFFAEFINNRISFVIESTGVPQLTVPQISRYELPSPRYAEQSAIATALSDTDALIESLEQLIAKKRQIKQGAMQELLTGKRRLPGFTGEWEARRLGDVAVTDPENLGSNTAPTYEFNYIALEDIDNGILRSYSEQVFQAAPVRARRKLQKEDVLVSTVRPNLKSHFLFLTNDGNWVCSTGFCVVRCKDRVAYPLYVFLHMFADGVGRQIDALLTGSSYPAINSANIHDLTIPLPSYDEQTAIATTLSDMDAEITALEAKRVKAQKIKQGMMHELLTGRIRLVNERRGAGD